jgi:ParB family chromosome partitioning protein
MKFPAFKPIELKSNLEALEILKLPLSQIVPDETQPRKNFEISALEELAESIRKSGILQPIIVKKIEENKYQIIAGERRWRASRIAGKEIIPAIIQNNSDQENVAISLIENIQREELNPIELAQGLHRLHTEHALSHENIASMIGKNRVTVTNLLRLLTLSSHVKDLLLNKKLEMGHAKVLVSLPPEKQLELANKTLERNLTVRDLEKLVKNCRVQNESKQEYFSNEIESLIGRLSHALESRISIKMNENGSGKLVINFSSHSEIQWIVGKLEKF